MHDDRLERPVVLGALAQRKTTLMARDGRVHRNPLIHKVGRAVALSLCLFVCATHAQDNNVLRLIDKAGLKFD